MISSHWQSFEIHSKNVFKALKLIITGNYYKWHAFASFRFDCQFKIFACVTLLYINRHQQFNQILIVSIVCPALAHSTHCDARMWDEKEHEVDFLVFHTQRMRSISIYAQINCVKCLHNQISFTQNETKIVYHIRAKTNNGTTYICRFVWIVFVEYTWS